MQIQHFLAKLCGSLSHPATSLIPELSLPGFPVWWNSAATSFHKRDGSCFRAKASASNTLGWVVVEGFFYTFRQRGSVWNSAFSPSNPRNYSVFQGPKPVTTSQPLPSHLCHVSSDREMGELWVQEGQKNGASHAQKTFIESTVIHRQKAPTLESLPLPSIEL